MADGHRVYPGAVASNRHPLGTLLRLDHRIRFHDDHFVGRDLVKGPLRWHRYLRVRDRIGWGSDLDIWMGRCGDMNNWGRHTVTYRVVR